jgi:hypothetical protein
MYRYGTSSKQATLRLGRPLQNSEIATVAPSVLATAPHDSRGERYAFIPTIQVLDGLRKEGFQPYEVRQTLVRKPGKRDFTKHMVRLRPVNEVGTQREEAGEIILINSHDGSSSYQLMAGFFRFVCSNGLIAGDVCEDIRVRHTGKVVDDVIEGSFRVLDNLQLAEERIDTYKSITLAPEEQLLLANSAIDLRWGEGNNPVSNRSVLAARRYQDDKPDLWTTFNRIQENLIDGGLRGRTTTNRRMTTRPVGGVNENVKLNRALWSLADGMAKLKQGVAPELVAA